MASTEPHNLGTEFNENVKKVGEEIFQLMGQQKVSIFNKDWWYGNIMDWSMKNQAFKTQMFRFVDVLPYLQSGSEVARHLKEYFAEGGEQLPSVFNMGVGLGSLAPGIMAGAIKKNVTEMAKMFITGATPEEALPILKRQREKNIAFTVDLLGEATLSEAEARDYHQRYIDLINWLCKDAESWTNKDLIDSDDLGEIPKVNVSVKLTAIYSQIDTKAWEESKEQLKEKLRPLLDLAMENQVFLNIDMEDFHVKDLTLEVFSEVINERKYKNYPHFGVVIQAYLRDSFADCQKLTQLAKKRRVPITIRLVKGAYWDHEVVDATQKHWKIPVYTNKQESDANYENCTRWLLDHHPHIKLAIGSHNVRSVAHAISYAKKKGLPKNALEIQMLYGMADPIKGSLVDMGYRVREYATVGELIPGMAYLVRRLLENTSNESFLKSKFMDNVDSDKLLIDPSIDLQFSSADPEFKEDNFINHALLDFAEPEPREKLTESLKKVAKQFPVKVPAVVNGKDVWSKTFMDRESPNEITKTVAKVYMADTHLADQAVASAKMAFESWSTTPVEERAALIDKLADLIAENRYQMMAVQIHEVGKPWYEADGDITEAIDFCRYYARDMRKLASGQKMGHAPGETTIYSYIPRGVAAVIAPWNFPLAILTGLAASAAVTGNTVIIKPAEQSSLTAYGLMKLIKKAGFPPGVFQFVPGYGEEVGAHLVAHPDVSTIGFTGSKEVGLKIIEACGKVVPGQVRVKKCVTEMGGKNAIIVDNDADLDEAVKGVIYSAFGFQGQKCSACSRAIVHQDIYDRFIDRLVAAAKSLHVGSAAHPRSFMGPVVDKVAFEKIQSMIEVGKSEGTVISATEVSADGYFVAPTIIKDVSATSRVATEEIFGPVLAVIKVKNIDEAIKVTMDSEYALTAGLFSRSPENIKKVTESVVVGNLYINRSCTGAMVDRHPFGGFKMSGIGCKTGGPDYLRQFMDARCVIENTMRRGFTPDLL